MLIPQIYICNLTQFEYKLPKTEEAQLHEVSKAEELPSDEIALILTERPQDLTELDLYGKPRYFVYFGQEKELPGREVIVIDSLTEYPDEKQKKAFLKRWIRIIVRDYLASLYQSLLQTLIDSSPDMMWVKDREDRYVILNNAYCDIVGKKTKDCLNKRHPELWDDVTWVEYESEDYPLRKSEKAVMESGKTMEFQEPVKTGGTLKQFTTYRSPLYDGFGKLLGTCGIGHDVSNIDNMGKELDIFLSAFPYPVFFCDGKYEIMRMNSGAERLFRGMKQLTNYKVWKDFFLKKESNSMMNDASVHVLQEGANKYYYSVAERDIKDSFGNVVGYFCMLRDVSYQRMYEELMFRAANIDPLTEAYNRRYFYELLDKHTQRPVTLLYMDLDNFKKVNDQYGHNKGDEILIETVRAIKQQFPGQQVVRLGGDEFALVISEFQEEAALKPRLDTISKKIESLADPSVQLGVSIGYGATPSLTNVEEFINYCDDRMYEVKNQRHAAR